MTSQLSKNEFSRYNRQIILSEIGLDGQLKLKNASVLMIGAGGLGCPVLQYLAASGVGNIGIVDDDLVDESNLQRQILYNTADVGLNKAETAAKKLSFLNPHIQIEAFPIRINSENCKEIIGKYELIIDGTDNFTTRYLVNDCCVTLNKTLVFGSIFKFEGQVSVFNFQGGPTLRCIYPEAPSAEEVPNCSEIGVLGVLPGIVGLYMANEALKIVLNIGEVLSGKLLVLNSLDNTHNIFKFKRTISYDNSIVSKQPVPDKITAEENEISWEEYQANSGNYFLVDVREIWEHEDENIGGINISYSEVTDHLDELRTDKNVLFYCQTGQRSKVAVTLLKQKSFSGNIFTLKGGIQSINTNE
ncbi:MAG: hypothetical protein JWQ25_449 [Daejeonella sp.]|nr:hypothetical protein [Daejeonella sp.]